MAMKKRIPALLLAIVMLVAITAACGEKAAPEGTPGSGTTGSGTTGGGTTGGGTTGGGTTGGGTTGGGTTGGGTAGGEETPQAERVLRYAMTSNMADMHPYGPSGAGKTVLRYWIYEYLATFTEFGTPWYEMNYSGAKNIEQIDIFTYHIEIYDYIYDQIGNHITADDIIWSIWRIAHGGNYPTILASLQEINKLDEYKLEIVFSTPVMGAFEYLLVQVPMVSQKTFEENEDTMSATPILTSAYRITECVQGAHYVIERNPDYWQHDESLRSLYMQQPVDKIIVYVMGRGEAAVALENGEVDAISALNDTEMVFFMNEDGSAKPGYEIAFAKGSSSATLNFNLERGQILADNLALRQAILYAIDMESIHQYVLGGDAFAEIQYDIAHNDSADHNMAWRQTDYYGYNVDKAKQLMVDAGYPNGVDPATGRALKLTIMGRVSVFGDIALVIQANLAQIGIDLEVLILDDTLVSTYSMEPGYWDLLLSNEGNVCYCVDIYDRLFGPNSDGLGNKTFHNDPVLYDLLSKAQDVRTHNQATVDALHWYVRDNALAIGMFQIYQYSVGLDGMVMYKHPWGAFVPSASDFTEFFARQG